MAWGPGKYDAECTELRERVKAEGVIVVVFGGDRGAGFSAQLSPTMNLALPKILRDLAAQIESSGVGV